jgi:uncharacterized membrane protein
MPLLTIMLMLGYPILIHLSIHFQAVDMAVYVLSFYCVLPLLIPAMRKRLGGMNILLLCLLSLSVLLVGFYLPEKIVVLPPILIFATMAYTFASTLRSGSVPLITRIALVIRGELPDYVMVYTRKATLAWVIFFLVMMFINLFLAMFASLEIWSYFANFIAWGLTGLMFLGEYLVRRYSMPNHVDYSFAEFLRNLARVDYRHVLK